MGVIRGAPRAASRPRRHRVCPPLCLAFAHAFQSRLLFIYFSFLGQCPAAAELMDLFTWSAEGGLRRRSHAHRLRPPEGLLRPRAEEGAEPRTRITTSLTSLSLVVGMNIHRSW